MVEPFAISFTTGAEADLKWLSAYPPTIILDGVEAHLRHHPTLGTRRIKALRDNPVAGWELRLGEYRVLYDVDETNRNVIIEVIGQKQGNQLLVQGKAYARHESNRSE